MPVANQGLVAEPKKCPPGDWNLGWVDPKYMNMWEMITIILAGNLNLLNGKGTFFDAFLRSRLWTQEISSEPLFFWFSSTWARMNHTPRPTSWKLFWNAIDLKQLCKLTVFVSEPLFVPRITFASCDSDPSFAVSFSIRMTRNNKKPSRTITSFSKSQLWRVERWM